MRRIRNESAISTTDPRTGVQYVADRAAWLLPCGLASPASGWAATSNVEVGQTADPVARKSVGREGERGTRDEVAKRRRVKG